MTAWQILCAGLAALHQPDGECCTACTRAHGRPIAYPCPRARLAAEQGTAGFAAFQAPGRRTEAAGHRPHPGRWSAAAGPH